jgi:predicted glycoside hydrolase/deacetylase ChbG (UPF0249 family)
VVGPAIGRDDVSALQAAVAANPNCAIGLHATLTAPFHPLTMHYRPLLDGLFLPLGKMLRAGLLRRLDRDMIQAELTAQIAKFAALFGRPPDYIDGHQHVQTFPQVRDAFLAAAKAHAPDAWVRQSGHPAASSRCHDGSTRRRLSCLIRLVRHSGSAPCAQVSPAIPALPVHMTSPGSTTSGC